MQNDTENANAGAGTENEVIVRPPVSFGHEQLILVDAADQVVGYSSKRDAHAGPGLLHRAFSVFLFDQRQRLLVHRRSEQKPLWPGYWTNSCCSHPRRGEVLDSAVARRTLEELGVTAAATHVYAFEYRAEFGELGTEHELCHVFLAHAAGSATVSAHADEIAEWRWLEMTEVDRWMRECPDMLTPWFRQEWASLRGPYASELDLYLAGLAASREVA